MPVGGWGKLGYGADGETPAQPGNGASPAAAFRLGARSVDLFFFQAEDGIRDIGVTGVQTCALPILFDLVVFDEASQIRVADAVGALGRARAAVVVGDSRQMPPMSFAEPTYGGTDDDAVELLRTSVEDEESILSECVQARVPRQWLSWHYRSHDESLIAFSNANYYDNRLSSFPAPTHGRPSADVDGRGISLIRVNGTFHRTGAGRLLRTNPMEAKAVVAEVRRRFDASPDVVPSIGVVTFNAQQRAYIEGLLRDTGDERLVEALDRTDGEGLFVKNLENVQGDERDVEI